MRQESHIISGMFPDEKFEEQCLAKATELSKLPLSVVSYTKALLDPYGGELLERYLNLEFDIMQRVWADKNR